MVPNEKLSRRKFLVYLGSSAAVLASATSGLSALVGGTGTAYAEELLFGAASPPVTGSGVRVKPSSSDELNLPQDSNYEIIAAYGDPINAKGELFGYDCSSAIYFPDQGSSVKGLLYVNHSASHPLWGLDRLNEVSYTPKQITACLYNQGGSVLEVYRDSEGTWRMAASSSVARRITGLEPFRLTGPVRGAKAVNGAMLVQGTFANATGGATLWDSVLTCEGEFERTCRVAGLDPSHYGWVAEVAPADAQFKPCKHTALGRFHHSGAVMGLSSDSRVVVYMGDSSGDGCLYKFVSNGTFDATRGLNNSDLLNSGALYAADLAMGQWIELTVENVKRELNRSDLQIPNTISYGVDQLRAMFQEQTDVLAHAHEAALVLGATPLDRQGGLVLHPADRSLFVSLTGNDRHGNMHGQIIRLIENDGDAGAAEFEFEQIASGGRQSGFSSPAGIAFDRSGQLWVASAIHSAKLHQGAYRTFENNGLYVLPLQDGPDAVTQFAAAPVEAALAAPAFTPNEQTLFIAVQHPGDRSTDPAKATSLWPHRSGDTMPRPALAAVTRTR